MENLFVTHVGGSLQTLAISGITRKGCTTRKETTQILNCLDVISRLLNRASLVMFICDFCGKEKKSRNILWKHLHAVHANNPSPCKFCGKIFRNKALLQAHMIYHKESKRIHSCPMCPEKPPYVTAVALRRHQETHHGYGAGYNCEVCYAVFK